ncbi:hypothetical protein ZIOFF_038735 [Zingiber officinale]|uniref:PGG domain-containing protein n=1 Tax=Zingiber officinale TaxID=94328 RepID=A0A8J5GA75_ZINOF|nr:hypothetical protein ZIOFF_038735 [Zingiber officinale]
MVNKLILDEGTAELVWLAQNKPDRSHVNLMDDPVLSVVIDSRKTQMALELIKRLPADKLEARNCNGDTALHVAATIGDGKVANALLNKSDDLADIRNSKGETPLHKAALYGQQEVFQLLVDKGNSWAPFGRTYEGATTLHCAIMGNAPRIPLDDESLDYPRKQSIRDIEFNTITAFDKRKGNFAVSHSKVRRLYELKEVHRDTLKLIEFLTKYRGYFGLFISGDRRDYRVGPSSREARRDNRERKKGPESEQRDLLLAFVDKLLHLDDATRGSDAPAVKGLLQSATRALESMSSKRNWKESPLIMGAEMGLPELVGMILQVCPESATYVDSRGRNVLQAAIESGSREIVEIIRKKTAGHNPVLPFWLLSHTKSGTRKTILHFASERTPPDTDDAVQLQDELLFFESVKDMVPKELVYSRNEEEMTAQEVFSERHKEMFRSCKNQLMEMGKTCSGLLAAVVFASSFSIPGEKDEKTGNPVYMDRLPFKIFSHTYVIGLSCATTSLVLFLSLLFVPYKEQQFRRAIPTKYFLACLSFVMALLALLVSFTCNIFLQIYGGQRTESDDLIPLILELTVFPALCLMVLYYRGATVWPAFRPKRESQGGEPPIPQSSACIKQYACSLAEKHCSGVFATALQHPGASRSLPEDPDVRMERTQPLTAVIGPKHSFTVGGGGTAICCGNGVCGRRRQFRQNHWASSSEQSLNPSLNCASAVGGHTPRLATTTSSRSGSSSIDRFMEIAVIVVVDLLMRQLDLRMHFYSVVWEG